MMTEHSIELPVSGTPVTFGKRLRGSDLFMIDADPQSRLMTQYELLIARAAIIRFGASASRPSLQQLLALDSGDIDALRDEHDAFLTLTRGEHYSEVLSDSEVKIAFGLEIAEVVYTLVRFGNRVNGNDLVEAEKTAPQGLRRECFLIGKQISELSTEDGALQLEGMLDFKHFSNLDCSDIATLQLAASRWRGSFRSQRKGIQRNDGKDGSGSSKGTKLERAADTRAASGAT